MEKKTCRDRKSEEEYKEEALEIEKGMEVGEDGVPDDCPIIKFKKYANDGKLSWKAVVEYLKIPADTMDGFSSYLRWRAAWGISRLENEEARTEDQVKGKGRIEVHVIGSI